MSSVRILSLAAAFVLSLSSVACVAAAPTEQGQKNANGLAIPSGNPSSSTAADTNGTSGACDGVCTHYFECASVEDTADNRSACENKCVSMNASAADLAAFQQADCTTIMNSTNNTNNNGGNGGGTTTSKGKECNGCVKDGDSCVWLSESNWGAGPYSGAAADCNAYCCQ